MKLQELHQTLIEQVNQFIAEDQPVSNELRSLIHDQLEDPLIGKTVDINKTISAAALKFKSWAMDQLRTIKISDLDHKALLLKIINHPEQVARELAMNIIKRKLQ